MMNKQTIVIETDRLIIAKLTEKDTAFVLELFNDADFVRFIGDRGIQTLEDAQTYLVNGPLYSYEHNGFGLYLTSLKHNAVQIGICGLIKRESLADVDIGYAFLPAYRGKGYGLEAATAVTNYAQNTLKLQRIVAITAPNNKRSIKLLEKLGFQFDKLIKLSSDGDESKLFVSDF